MRISSLNINNFRNFKKVRLRCLGLTNVMIGQNASGKSNFIEVLRYLTLTRSYKNIPDKSLLTWGEKQAIINAKIKAVGSRFYLSFVFDKAKQASFKEIYLDQALTTATAVLGKVKTLCFSVEDLNYFLDSPCDRRKYF